MKKLIVICIGATIVLLSFLYCLPHSISYVEIIGFMEIATFGILINYSSYIIAIYLAKINLLNKIIDKTSGLIIGIPYAIAFFSILMFITYMIAIISTKTFSLTGIVFPTIASIDCLIRIKKIIKTNSI